MSPNNKQLARAINLGTPMTASRKKKGRKLILCNCIICGQVISVEKRFEDDETQSLVALDVTGQKRHVCPAASRCPYCCEKIKYHAKRRCHT